MSQTGYVKIYGSILGSSVWAEAPATRIVWITMLALADANGHVEASVSGLARYANVSPRQCAAALDILAAPDPDSKSPAHEGRRIEKADRGWAILNYLTYRELQSPKQIADAARAQDYRDRKAAEREAERLAANERDASQTSSEVAATVTVDGAVTVESSSSPPPLARWKPIVEADMADRLTTDGGRVALAGVLTVARIKSAVISELNACLGGDRGPQHHCTFAQLDMALSDYFGNGMSNDGTWNANHFRACIRTAMKVHAESGPRLVKPKANPDDAAQGHVASIRKLIQTNGQSRFIPKGDVEAMGPEVLAAYLSLGGADRFLNVAADKLSFLVRDFAAALRTTHAA